MREREGERWDRPVYDIGRADMPRAPFLTTHSLEQYEYDHEDDADDWYQGHMTP
jgi:hypothetical protein